MKRLVFFAISLDATRAMILCDSLSQAVVVVIRSSETAKMLLICAPYRDNSECQQLGHSWKDPSSRTSLEWDTKYPRNTFLKHALDQRSRNTRDFGEILRLLGCRDGWAAMNFFLVVIHFCSSRLGSRKKRSRSGYDNVRTHARLMKHWYFPTGLGYHTEFQFVL